MWSSLRANWFYHRPDSAERRGKDVDLEQPGHEKLSHLPAWLAGVKVLFHRTGHCLSQFEIENYVQSRGMQEMRMLYDILADLVAEGWTKAVVEWKKRTKLSARFDARMNKPSLAARSICPVWKLSVLLPMM